MASMKTDRSKSRRRTLLQRFRPKQLMPKIGRTKRDQESSTSKFNSSPVSVADDFAFFDAHSALSPADAGDTFLTDENTKDGMHSVSAAEQLVGHHDDTEVIEQKSSQETKETILSAAGDLLATSKSDDSFLSVQSSGAMAEICDSAVNYSVIEIEKSSDVDNDNNTPTKSDGSVPKQSPEMSESADQNSVDESGKSNSVGNASCRLRDSVESLPSRSEHIENAEPPLMLSRDDDTQELVATSCLQARAKDYVASSLQVGHNVAITGGKYEGKRGVVTKITAKMVELSIDGLGKRKVLKGNVSSIFQTEVPQSEASSLAVQAEESLKTDSDDSSLSISPKHSDQENDGRTSSEKIKVASVSAAPKGNATSGLQVGLNVAVVGGKYKGKRGVITKITAMMVEVSMEGMGERKVRKSNVSASVSSDGAHASTSLEALGVQVKSVTNVGGGVSPTSEALVTSSSAKNHFQQLHDDNAETLAVGRHVSIDAGKHRGKSGTITELLPKMVKVMVEGQGEEVKVRKTSIEGFRNKFSNDAPVASCRTSAYNTTSGEEWKLPDSTSGGTRFGSRMVVKMRLATKGQTVEDTFLSNMLGNRMKVIEVALNQQEIQEPFDKYVQENGYRYELISTKVQNDGDAPSLQHTSPKCIRLVYSQVSGPCLTPCPIQETLLNIADFSALDPRKAMARLELLQSPAYKFGKKEYGIFFLRASEFCEILDEGNEGCGFISEDFLVDMLGNNKAAKQALAIQVRVIVPSLGIHKGVLMRKRITSGPPIQLPSSMKKVGPSKDGNVDDRAFLLITQAGLHPNSNNKMVGRLLDEDAKPPPKSFKPKPLSDMIPRLWRGLGVPKEVCDEYVKKSVRTCHLAHAYVVGVADPTGQLPAGHIFVTGMGGQAGVHKQLFVTRSPCILPSDGCMVSCVQDRPENMSKEVWKWLTNLPFGSIIFGKPREGTKPLPTQIAKGDLDGDLYFVCWNKEILSTLQAGLIEEEPLDKEESKTGETGRRDDWLERAQLMMVDSIAIEELGALTGKLYTLSAKAADSSPDFMSDRDAVAFAKAFNQALEFSKHGKIIRLPERLHDQVPARFHKHLTAA